MQTQVHPDRPLFNILRKSMKRKKIEDMKEYSAAYELEEWKKVDLGSLTFVGELGSWGLGIKVYNTVQVSGYPSYNIGGPCGESSHTYLDHLPGSIPSFFLE